MKRYLTVDTFDLCSLLAIARPGDTIVLADTSVTVGCLAQSSAAKPVSLPDDSAARNEIPMADGLLYYFPNALAEVAKVSKIGNDQHNPGQPMHWAREKSEDHANKILRHLVDAGAKDSKGIRHSAYLAWRALALLQVELEKQEGVPRPRNAY